MYREQLEPEIAQNLLNEEYDPSVTYYLLSDRDIFTITGYSTDGRRVLDKRLEQERNVEEFTDDTDEFNTETSDIEFHLLCDNFGTVALIICALLCAGCIIGAVCIINYWR